MKEALRRAILTLAAVPDPDRKYLTIATPSVHVVRDAAEAYGWTPEIVSFRPTPRDVQVYLDVLSWLTWYERARDDETVKLFIAWSTGAEWWKLSRRFSASERTLRRWIDNMCCVIYYQFESAFKKIFLDECPECLTKGDSSMYLANGVSTDTEADIEPLPKSSTSWNSGGVQPSLDMSIPVVAEERQKLVERLEKQNRKRRRADRRKAKKLRKQRDC